MDTPHQKNAAERIRPILQAMEASINSARRNRVKDVAPPMPRIERSTVASIPPASIPAVSPAALPMDTTQRLKAKPKRLNTPFTSAFDQTGYRSQAG